MDYVPFELINDTLSYMRGFGFSQRTLLAKAEISDAILARFRQSGRAPLETLTRLNRVSVEMVPSELKQSAWCGGFGGNMFRLMAFSIISAPNLGKALERGCEFHRLLDTRYPDMSLSLDNGWVQLAYTPPEMRYTTELLPSCPDAGYLENMTIMSGLNIWSEFMNWLIGQKIRLNRVGVHDPAFPGYLSRKLQKLISIEQVVCGERQNYLEFSLQYLDCPIVQTTSTLDRFFEWQVQFAIDNGAEQPIAKLLRSLLGDDLSGGCPSFEEIAGQLTMSRSGLRRRLVREGTSYQEVKNSVRQQLAFRMLRQTKLPINVVAERSGFSEQGSFSRLFRQWTGLSPSEFRGRARETSPVTDRNIRKRLPQVIEDSQE